MHQKVMIAIMLCLITTTVFVSAQTIIPGGIISGTWTASGSPYLIQGEITVPAGETLNIGPGVEVIFQGHYKLIVNGWLEAIGTETDSILFTAEDTLVGWWSIRFVNAPDTSHVKYCVIQHSHAVDPDCNGGAIYCYYSNPFISHCTIRKNSASSSGYDGNGGGICCDHSSPIISYCDIIENYARWVGGGIFDMGSSYSISYCTIRGNSAGAGGGVYVNGSTANINHCTIVNNMANPLNGGGIGLWLYYGTPVLNISNSVFEGNGGEACIDFYCTNYGSIVYNDFFNNQGGSFAGTVPQNLGQIVTANANGDSCDIFYNIFEDPLFADTSNNNFQITWLNFPIPDSTKSPCIDAGNPNSGLDPDSTIADMGAFYFDQTCIPPAVQVTMTPYSPPIIIPPEGSAFMFNIQFTNNSSDTAVFDAWINIEIPSGYQFTLEEPVYGITLAPGGTIERDRRVFVPPNAPAGEYSCIAMIGTYPWNVIGSDAFAFSKQGTDHIWRGSKDWRINGESFDE